MRDLRGVAKQGFNVYRIDDARPWGNNDSMTSKNEAMSAVSAEVSGASLAGGARTLGAWMVLIANVLIIVGGVAISVIPGVALTPWVFLMFLAGHAVWSVHALRSADKALLGLNAAMALLDVYAVFIRL